MCVACCSCDARNVYGAVVSGHGCWRQVLVSLLQAVGRASTRSGLPRLPPRRRRRRPQPMCFTVRSIDANHYLTVVASTAAGRRPTARGRARQPPRHRCVLGEIHVRNLNIVLFLFFGTAREDISTLSQCGDGFVRSCGWQVMSVQALTHFMSERPGLLRTVGGRLLRFVNNE